MRQSSRLGLISLGLSLGSASAVAGPCSVEHGYLVCHAATVHNLAATLSFAPAQVVTTLTTQAEVCSMDGSGIKSVRAWHKAYPDAVTEIQVSSHDQACTGLGPLHMHHPGSWQMTVDFNDGEQVVFNFPVCMPLLNPS